MYLLILPENDDVKTMYENHKHYHIGDCGLDLYCPEDILIKAKSTQKIDMKIKCEPFKNSSLKTHCSYYLYPRSSISKTPLRMSNSVGIIDSGYRGNLIMVVDNIYNEDYLVKKGQRLCQICSPNLNSIKFKLVSKLSDTTRGSGGFGSTGK